MLLYTETVNDIFGGVSDSQVMSTLATAIASSSQALNDSGIDAEFRLVYAGPVRTSARVFTSSSFHILYERFIYNILDVQISFGIGVERKNLVHRSWSDYSLTVLELDLKFILILICKSRSSSEEVKQRRK